MSRPRNHYARLTAEETVNFAELWSGMFHDTKTLIALLRRVDHPRYRGGRKYMERRALRVRRCLALAARVNTPADILQLAELTAEEKKLTNQKFYEWAVEYSPFRLRQIEGHLTGRPSAERVISERLWDTRDLSWQRWTRKEAVHVGVPIVTGEPHQHHASA